MKKMAAHGEAYYSGGGKRKACASRDRMVGVIAGMPNENLAGGGMEIVK